MDYFSVDVESSGPVPGFHSLLSVGVTHVRRFQGRYRPFADLYLELAPAFTGEEPAAMATHGLDPERLRAEGLSAPVAMAQLAAWVKSQQKAEKERPVFVAHNAPFDWMYVTYYFALARVENPFGHSALDIKAYAMGRLGLAWNQTSLAKIVTHLPGLPERAGTLHHAGADARYQAEVFCALMNRGGEG